MALDAATRRQLRAQAHNLSVIVQTGAQGVTEAVIDEIDRSISHHELMKVRLAGAERSQRRDTAAEMAERLNADVVGIVGNVVILYRPSPDDAS